jgi:hypothetical protein
MYMIQSLVQVQALLVPKLHISALHESVSDEVFQEFWLLISSTFVAAKVPWL